MNDVLEIFKNRLSVHKIIQTFMTDEEFSFKIITEDIVRKEIMNLDVCKPTPNGDICVSILKSTVDIHLRYIGNIINLSMEESPFPDELKLAKVSPVFKKKNGLDKDNYRPVSALPHVSKVI